MAKQITFKSGGGIEFTVDNISKNVTVSSNNVVNDLTGNEVDKSPSVKVVSDKAFLYRGRLPNGDYNSNAFWINLKIGLYIYSQAADQGTNAPANYGVVEVYATGPHAGVVYGTFTQIQSIMFVDLII